MSRPTSASRVLLCASVLWLGAQQAPLAAAKGPYLVRDIARGRASSNPIGWVQLGAVVLFTATDDHGDTELWRSDGTARGTFRLVDACKGKCSGSPGGAGASPKRLFFSAFDENGTTRAIWVTDGTSRRTVRLLKGLPRDGTIGGRWVPSLGRHFLAVPTADGGGALWSSDGTVAGTRLVADGFQSLPLLYHRWAVFRDRLYFVADDGVAGPSLWTSDGTRVGTYLVKDCWPGSTNHPGPEGLTVVGQRLLFRGISPTAGVELWTSDGTADGTMMLLDLSPGPIDTMFLSDFEWPVIGTQAYFVADYGNGYQLLVSDGTLSGTRTLTSFAEPLALGDGSRRLDAFDGRLFFVANDVVHGRELWTSDGTVAGTRLLADLCPGSCSGIGWLMVNAGSSLLVTANDGSTGEEIWSVDKLSGEAHRVADFCPGACSSYPWFMGTAGSRWVFSADGTGGTGLFTVVGGEPLPLAPAEELHVGWSVARIGGLVLFQGNDGVHGTELWATDGTARD